MKRIRFNDALLQTRKFVDGELSVIVDVAIDPAGKESVERDGQYFVFSDGTRVHCRYSEKDCVAVVMSYKNAGLPERVFGMMRGWNDRRFVDALYMPHRFVVEKVRCVRVQDLTEEEILRAGVRKNAGGKYMAGGVAGGVYGSAVGAWKALYCQMLRVPYALNPWVIVYEVTPLLGDVNAYGRKG